MAERKTQRVRIDAIVNAIKRGEYDDKLSELRKAIDERNEQRQEQVMALVGEVFGPNYVVVPKPDPSQAVPRSYPSDEAPPEASAETQGELPEVRNAIEEDPGDVEEIPMHLRGAIIGPPPPDWNPEP